MGTNFTLLVACWVDCQLRRGFTDFEDEPVIVCGPFSDVATLSSGRRRLVPPQSFLAKLSCWPSQVKTHVDGSHPLRKVTSWLLHFKAWTCLETMFLRFGVSFFSLSADSPHSDSSRLVGLR